MSQIFGTFCLVGETYHFLKQKKKEKPIYGGSIPIKYLNGGMALFVVLSIFMGVGTEAYMNDY